MEDNHKRKMRAYASKLMKEVYAKYGKYPVDLIDQVFVGIEKNHKAEYDVWVDSYHDQPVNSYIGRYIKVESGLENLSRVYTPVSKLIKSYMQLG